MAKDFIVLQVAIVLCKNFRFVYAVTYFCFENVIILRGKACMWFS